MVLMINSKASMGVGVAVDDDFGVYTGGGGRGFMVK
jgi:hypothetical protein